MEFRRIEPASSWYRLSLIFNWVSEAARFAPGLRVLHYTGAGRKREAERLGPWDLIVTTYGTLWRDAESSSEYEFDYVVLDEAAVIKNPESRAAKAARLMKARYRLALSGTPVENHLGDLWSLIDFLNPGMLGRVSRFKQNSRYRAKTADHEEVAEAIAPFILRRTKAEVLTELPPKTEAVIQCKLGLSERRRYEQLREHYRDQLLEKKACGDGGTFLMLEGLVRLRQATCHPGLVDAALLGDDSSKVRQLLRRVSELTGRGHKVLVFSQFTTLLGVVRDRLDGLGL